MLSLDTYDVSLFDSDLCFSPSGSGDLDDFLDRLAQSEGLEELENSSSEADTNFVAPDDNSALSIFGTEPLSSTSSLSSELTSALEHDTAPTSLPPSGLTLNLNHNSVANAWQKVGGGRPAILAGGAELYSLLAFFPYQQDIQASLSVESVLAQVGMAPGELTPQAVLAPPSPPVRAPAPSAALAAAINPADEEAARKAAAERKAARERARRRRNQCGPRKVRYEARRINAEKRPRIKGRFVTQAELEEYMRTQQAQQGAAAPMMIACM